MASKNISKDNRHSPFEFSKLFLMAEVKIITLSDEVLNICRGHI